ncbi:MAG: short-chain dehydrogenase, partial [Polaromonas sp.]|nr:short-chain dehydrogenase [Polaromonas sp.]
MPKPPKPSSAARPSARGEATTAKQQKIQRGQDSKDLQKNAERKSESSTKKKAVQAGARKHPEPPLPDQHLRKPGLEADMELKPQFMAPGYKGSGKLD